MDELIKAILARYEAAAGATLKAATPGGMWLDQAPTISSGTFIVVTIVNPLEEEFVMNSTVSTGETMIQFAINNTAAGTDTLVVAAKALLRTLYHDVILTGLSGVTVMMAKCKRERGPVRDPDSTGYQFFVETHYMLGK